MAYVAKYFIFFLSIIATIQINIVASEYDTTRKIDDDLGEDSILEDFVEDTTDLAKEDPIPETNDLVSKLEHMEAAFDDFVRAVSEKQTNLQAKARDMYPSYSEYIKNSKDAVTNFTAAIGRDAKKLLDEMIRKCPKNRKLYKVCIADTKKQMLNGLTREQEKMHTCLSDHLRGLREEEQKWQEIASSNEDRFEESVEKSARSEDEILKNAKEIVEEFVGRLDKLENSKALSAMESFISEVETKRGEVRDCLDGQKAYIDAQSKLKDIYKCIKTKISRSCPVPSYKTWKNDYGNVLSSETSLLD